MDALYAICEVTFTPGKTPLNDVNHRHADVHILAHQVDAVTRIFLEAYQQGRCRRYTKSVVVNLIKAAFQADRIDLEAVNPQLAPHIANL